MKADAREFCCSKREAKLRQSETGRRDCSRRVSRRGAAIVFAMLALLTATIMITTLMRTVALIHRQMGRDVYLVQAGLLADAGVQRAELQMKNQADWKEGVWTVSGDELGTGLSAKVRMSIESHPARSERPILKVIAEYPADHPSIVRVIRQKSAR